MSLFKRKRKDIWSLVPGDFPSEEATEQVPEFAELHDNPVFRYLKHHPIVQKNQGKFGTIKKHKGIDSAQPIWGLYLPPRMIVDLYLSGFSARDYAVAIWGHRCRRSRINFRKYLTWILGPLALLFCSYILKGDVIIGAFYAIYIGGFLGYQRHAVAVTLHEALWFERNPTFALKPIRSQIQMLRRSFSQFNKTDGIMIGLFIFSIVFYVSEIDAIADGLYKTSGIMGTFSILSLTALWGYVLGRYASYRLKVNMPENKAELIENVEFLMEQMILHLDTGSKPK